MKFIEDTLRIAILNLNAGQPNEGMRCIRELVRNFGEKHDGVLESEEFEVRNALEIPGLDFDIYISSGGPGSPLESEGSEWENRYFNWIKKVEEYNRKHIRKKHVLFICHSFQLACRFFNVANVTKRKSTSFGVFPVHMEEEGKQEPVFEGLQDPFYAVDSRDYQVIQPKRDVLASMGGAVLAIEKYRPHVPLERAVMAIRFNPYMLGTQFHPEADPKGMYVHFSNEERKNLVIFNFGEEKYLSMLSQLNDPEKILTTYSTVVPNFLNQAAGVAHYTVNN